MDIALYVNVFKFNIILNESWPVVWRSIHVPATYDFKQFRQAITEAMGWSGHSEHEFQMMCPYTGRELLFVSPNRLLMKEMDKWDQQLIFNETKAKIRMYFTETNSMATFIYDLVENWQHTIEFAGEVRTNTPQSDPVCVAGDGSCPIEGIGGIYAHRRMMFILGKPDHSEYDEMVQKLQDMPDGNRILCGPKFDPSSVFVRK